MWIPESAAEIEQAAQRGDLEETSTFDAKAALPVPKKNRDLAVDVCAMTVAGGSLVYGLGEDKNKRLTVLSPVDLEGAPERVAQIAETSISEPPFIRVQPLPTDNGEDMRYYGRGAKGNRILSEVEVAALYARREQWEVDREHLLDAELEKAPAPQAGLGYVVAYARPVVPDDSMVVRVASSELDVVALMNSGAKSWGDVVDDPLYGPL